MSTATAQPQRSAPPAEGRWRTALREIVANRLALAAAVFLGLFVVVALLGPWIVPYGQNEIDVQARLEAPGWPHVFGTDDLGRDVFSRVLLGARVSLLVGGVAVAIALTVGTTIGLLAGFYRGVLDDVLMRAMDVIFAFPALLAAIVVLALLGPGIINTAVAIGIVFIPIFARVARASALSVREEPYILAARSVGAADPRLLGLHMLPNIVAPIIVQISISLAFAILNEAALSFVGLGVQPPQPSWGADLAQARGFLQQAWWMAVFPGLAILATVLSLNVLGDALRDALDPRHTAR